MEAGKITITFKDDDTHEFEIKEVDGMQLLDGAKEIINTLIKKYDMPLPLISALIELSIQSESQD
jgi:coenzyme F420-reducing hydrogenase beta subunit